jgi:hypothetical protein
VGGGGNLAKVQLQIGFLHCKGIHIDAQSENKDCIADEASTGGLKGGKGERKRRTCYLKGQSHAIYATMFISGNFLLFSSYYCISVISHFSKFVG